MEQNYLNGSKFATLFLRAKHACEAVLKMLSWTSDISFIIDLGLMTSGRNNISHLIENS